MMPDWVFQILAWIPAVIFPAASGLQLLAIIRKRSADGVSVTAWALFAIANICLFIYTEKYVEAESIIGALGTATINVCIVIACFRYRGAAAGNGPRGETVLPRPTPALKEHHDEPQQPRPPD